MDHRALIAAALLVVAGAANAAYTNLRPPSGWSAVSSASKDVRSGPGWYTRGEQTTQTWSAEGTMAVDSTLGVFNKNVGVPAVIEAAVNTGAVLAPLVIANPYVSVGVTVASWLASAGLQWLDGTDGGGKGWAVPDATAVQSDGFRYWTQTTGYRNTLAEVCNVWTAAYTSGNWLYVLDAVLPVYGSGAGCQYHRVYVPDGTVSGQGSVQSVAKEASSCAVGWYYTGSGACVKTREYTRQSADEAATLLKGYPMPNGVLNEVPWAVPINKPKINDGKPLFIPSGKRVSNPAYDPNKPESKTNPKWLQPGYRLSPNNTDGSPWQVDLEPVDRPETDADPESDQPQAEDPDDPQGGVDAPKKDADLCAKYPQILACQEMGKLDDIDLQTKDEPMQITPAGGFGPSDASCPEGTTFAIGGQSFEIGFEMVCGFAHGVRPVVLGFAWLAAGLIFLGFIRREG